MQARAISVFSPALKLHNPNNPVENSGNIDDRLKETETPLFGLNIYKEDELEAPICFNRDGANVSVSNDWQVFKKPISISTNGNSEGAFLVELNESHYDFSKFGEQDLKRFTDELYFILNQRKVKKVILSFYNCSNLNKLKEQPVGSLLNSSTLSGPDYVSQALANFKLTASLNGKKFSIVHAEETLYRNEKLNGFEYLIHGNAPDALKDR